MITQTMETQDSSVFYTILQHSHSGLRWILLILLVLSIAKAYNKRKGGSVYPGKDSLFLATFIVTHTQLLLGLMLYFVFSPFVRWEGGMKAIMGEDITRFYTVEHFFGMIVAIIIISVGYIKAKKQAELNKGWKTIATTFLIGLIIILISIPWPFRNLGAGWF